MTTTPTDDLPLPERLKYWRDRYVDFWPDAEHSEHIKAMDEAIAILADRQARAAQAEPPLTESPTRLQEVHEQYVTESERAAAPQPEQQSTAQPVAYQRQYFVGSPDWIEPFWTEWENCTKEQYEAALAAPDWQARALCDCTISTPLPGLTDRINKIIAECVEAASKPRKVRLTPTDDKWDDGYLNGIKVLGTCIQAALRTASKPTGGKE